MASFSAKFTGNSHIDGFMPDGTPAFHTGVPHDEDSPKTELSPTDYVAAGLASCTTLIMSEFARYHGLNIDGTWFEVTKEMGKGKPARIGYIGVSIHIADRGLTEKNKISLERSGARCPVKFSLHPETEVEIEFDYFTPEDFKPE